ncbi:MAG: AAA family ATPase [Thermoplasmatales archaeon]|nr:AAA family ATPase [Thermoplasmatales archaeon]
MKKIVISSLDKKSGKSVVEIAMGKSLNKKIGYMKPIGSNPVHRGKKIVDYDTLLFKEIFDIDYSIEEMCLGVHHSKILHFYPDAKKEFMKRFEKLSDGKEFFMIEGGEYIWDGASIGIDALSLASLVKASLVFVLSGDYYEILDKLSYVEKITDGAGIIINKTRENIDEIEKGVSKRKMKFFGYLPYIEELRKIRVSYLAEKIFAKVVAGEGGLNKEIENVFVAALSAPEIKRHPDFRKGKKLIITGGDRTDVITACLEEDTSCILLTNNIVPPATIIAKANEKEIPLLSVRQDTYTVAKMVDGLQMAILPDEKKKIEEIEKAGRKHLMLDELIS